MSARASVKAPIAVTGVGAVSALGVGAAALLDGLRSGRCGIAAAGAEAFGLQLMAALPVYQFDLAVQGLALEPALAARVERLGHRAGPAQRSALLAAAEAWHQSGCLAGSERVGVVVAGSNLDQQGAAQQFARLAAGKPVRPSYASQFMDTDYVGLISEALGVRGEGYAAGAASASGGVALALARRALLSGDVDAVLVVGAPMMLSGAEVGALAAVGALYGGAPPAAGKFACRPFDRSAAGFVYGQAGAALVLERSGATPGRERAALALLAAAVMGLDANRSTNPSAGGEAGAMRGALAQAGLDAGAIGLVSAHGTASVLGDQTEAQALLAVFGQHGAAARVNMPKALLGHCLAGAGVLEAVALVLQLQHCFAHANPALEDPIEASLRWVGRHAEPCGARAAMSNSFGFGGINSCQIFTLPEE